MNIFNVYNFKLTLITTVRVAWDLFGPLSFVDLLFKLQQLSKKLKVIIALV